MIFAIIKRTSMHEYKLVQLGIICSSDNNHTINRHTSTDEYYEPVQVNRGKLKDITKDSVMESE